MNECIIDALTIVNSDNSCTLTVKCYRKHMS